MKPESKDVLEQNVSTLLESGGEAPRLSDVARMRMRNELIAKHGAAETATKVRLRAPVIAVAVGLVATAAGALIVSQFVGGEQTAVVDGKLADGSSFITEPGAKVTVIGPRRVRVEGAALLDIAPGKGTFVVETARGQIEVLGTRFLVDAEAQRTTTAVVRGTVKLATAYGTVVLHAGEQAVAEPGRAPVRGPAPRLSHLVSWAQAARRREEKTIEPVRNGTLFARDPGVRPNGTFGEEYPLPMKQLTLDVVVEDRVARVAMDQTFFNPNDRVLEGVYRFAIPSDAALQRLAMYVEGKLTESAVVERVRARQIYEELVYRRIDPALLEYAGTGRLDLRVYPLPAKQDKRLMLAYTQSLPTLYRDWTLSIPMPEVDQPVGEVLMSARIKGCANCELSSPSHAIAVERKGEDAIVSYRRTGEKIGDSFVIHVRDAKQDTTVARNEDFLLVRAPVELGTAPREYRPRTWVILDDVSASRSPIELKAQADLVDAFLRELDEDDKVAILAFDVEARHKLVPTRVRDVDRRAVRQALKQEGGVGATDFNKALAAAIKLLGSTQPDDAMIVYLGDGVITSGARTLDTLRAQLAGKARFIGVGVGDGADTQTLEGLAGATGGYSTTIDLSDDLGWRAFDLIAALHTSRVTGLGARLVDASGALVPSALYLRSPQLADGEELELVGKLAGTGTPAAVELTGTRDGKPWQQRIALGAAAGQAGYLPRLWAQRHIAARMLAKHEPVTVPTCVSTPTAPCPTEAQLRAQRDEEIRQEIVTLGKQYFLLSRHTSLLVLENDAMYAKYGVRKGSGDTWAPYAMPESIPALAKPVTNVIPADVADDAELFRTPLQVFYNGGIGGYRWGAESQVGDFSMLDGLDSGGGGSIGMGRFGNVGGGGSGWGARGGDTNAQTRASLGLGRGNAQATGSRDQDIPAAESVSGELEKRRAYKAKAADFGERMSKSGGSGGFATAATKRMRISTAELNNPLTDLRSNRRFDRGHSSASYYGSYQLQPARFLGPADQAFDDLTAFVPALVPDAADYWREELDAAAAGARSFPIDDGAKRLLAAARKRLPAGVYRWDTLEIAVDDARRFGWRRATDSGLDETASYDGAALTRRYAELGLSVTRPAQDDALAFALAYLPVWIAEPAQYARWFEVKLRGAREITLSTKRVGKEMLAFVLTFDDQARLVAISDGDGKRLLEVTWGAAGPTSARISGQPITVGFTAETVSDATQWAHRVTVPSVAIELPARLPAYWQAVIAKETAGTPAWRHAQRQLLVSAAAVADRATSFRVYDELRAQGGVELGDLVLASGGIATATTDAQLKAALAPLAKTALAQYLAAGRAYGKAPNTSRMIAHNKDGLLGALWQLRSITAELAANDTKDATAQLLAMGNRAFALRLVGAARVGQHWSTKPAEALAAWDSVAIGEYKNLVRAMAVAALYGRASYDLASDQVIKLVAELDLQALPPSVNAVQQAFNQSRRGNAGWHVVYAQWRNKVLAGTSFEHVMAFIPLAAYHSADLPSLLARASELAGTPDRKLAVVRLAQQYGHANLAHMLLASLLQTSPTREMYQLASSMAQTRGDESTALTYLEQAQDAGADEAVDINVVRTELRQIIALAQLVALHSTGAARASAVERAMRWGTRWRVIDPANVEIDRLLGEMLLAVGAVDEAWRQLSSTIEREPMASTGYVTVADAFERQGKVAEALELWQQAIVIDQTNPTPRLRKAQALFALGRTAEGDALLEQITSQKWHDVWSSVVYQANDLVKRSK